MLTYKDEASGLEELLVIPGGVLLFQQVAHAVVLTQPDRGDDHQPWEQPKHLLAHSHLILERDARWVAHQHRRLSHGWWVHLSVQHLWDRAAWQPGAGQSSRS